MNTRARVTTLPAMVAASLGLGSIVNLSKAVAHPGHVHASPSLQPAGLDEINLTIEDAGVTGMPESIAAGRYLVKITGPEPSDFGPAGVTFAQLPEGMTPQDAYDDVAANPEDMPSWYLETHFGGGAAIAQGTESWVVLDFTPGAWMVTTLYGTSLGVAFEVTGELPTDLPAVESNVTLDLHEMVISIAEGAFIAGENVVTVRNSGAQIHFVDIGMLPDGTTREQVDALMDSFMTGTPPAADGLQEDDLMPVAYLPDISGGVTQTLPLTLEAGTYFLSCWVPDPESGMPHAMMGMWDIVVVE